jgi:hypothetical protein
MSTLQVANIHLESTGNNRIQYTGSNSYTIYAGGVQSMSVNTTAVAYNAAITDSAGNIRDVPLTSKAATYTLTANDAGKMVSTTANVAVPASIFSNGQNISIFNNSASSITITQGSGVTMYLVGTTSTGDRTLAQRGLATVVCTAANTFVITGGGLT